MPTIDETTSILGYYDDSWEHAPSGGKLFADLLESAMKDWETPLYRWPVLNREPRTPISSQKRAIIHERDGGICRHCGQGGHILTADHIIPRSAFPTESLHIADRSDNLISACWPCNQAKSNFEVEQRKRLGVVVKCWHCLNPDHGDDEDAFLPHEVSVRVYCGQCGVSSVPSVEGWVL